MNFKNLLEDKILWAFLLGVYIGLFLSAIISYVI